MRILAIVHGYPPTHNAGAEWMLHEQLKYLQGRGHECEVMMKEEGEFEGIKIVHSNPESVKRADLIISHLKQAGRSLNICEYFHKPFVYVAHNNNHYHVISVKHKPIGEGRFIYVIYNSESLKSEMRYPNPSVVCRPHIDSKRYKTKRGDKITLINLFERKGGKFFHELAGKMPEVKFLGVEGSYGKQEKGSLSNVTYMKNTPDAKKIYTQTRILLMPSMYESYGRTGVEAMVSGIPVIAAPTPGLKESLGDAGIFCESPKEWIEAIKMLDDPAEYKRVSDKCTQRAKELEKETLLELANLDKFLNDILEHKI
jgi:glycosyltransferase involved in cell wall biosynthesis